eukprot:364443-Chlamydomonas_euryale.AAC.34
MQATHNGVGLAWQVRLHVSCGSAVATGWPQARRAARERRPSLSAPRSRSNGGIHKWSRVLLKAWSWSVVKPSPTLEWRRSHS